MSTRNFFAWVFAVAALTSFGGCAGLDPEEGSVDQELGPPPVPPPPTNLVGSAVSATEVDLSWDPVPGATVYIMLKGTAPGNETTLTTLSPASPTFKDGHDLPGMQYCYEVEVYIAGA